ncbi:ATP-binding protein [uncultured Mucilaginibacter sp.]|uniref:GAF domain-containing sensor histidine kinase n=1 Tax=uncultured Mucilaginibacter sp. TaxID=797541 RepID=UPI002609071E|nr:ATP-binding protein [uncultured Mucilaginibacter sp.]
MINTFTTDIIPANEQQRLEALHRYRLLGTYAEKSFKSIAKLVSEIFKTSIAMISLVDAEVVHFGSNVGMESTTGSRGESFCSLTILKDEVHVVENALENPVVASNPFVCGDFGLRFYAGAPLVTHDGFMIGTVCLVDTQSRKFNNHDRTVLEGLATVVMEQIELRLENLQNSEKQVEVNDQLLQSNDKLTASEQRFQYILDTMAEGVGIIDQTGQMVYANNMAQQILGLTHSEIKDRTFDDPRWQNLRIDGSPLPPEEHPMAVMMRTGLSLFDQEIGVQPPDKERFYVSINAAPIIEKGTGKITGGIGTFMDVTNRRRILQQKDEFINVVSHELKTPVTSLKAAMQVLNRMKDNPRQEVFSKMLAQSNTSLNKLSGLINDLLDSNRISLGQLQLKKTRFSIADLVNDCCSHVRTAGTHEIILQGDIQQEVTADESQIDQVIVNLVNNAVKYAPDSKTIEIGIEHLGQEAKISVKDNGPGIPVDQIPRLFDRYYRADYSSIQFSGLGLGLYISSEIIKKHGGRIGVDSAPGKGSSFWFTLPLR